MTNSKIPSEKNFGIVFTIFFLIISFLPLFFNKNINSIFLAISFFFLITTLTIPRYLKPLNLLWFKFGLFLGKYISPVIMGVIFFFLITPISFYLKILGKDILNLKTNKNETYWITRKIDNTDITKQF